MATKLSPRRVAVTGPDGTVIVDCVMNDLSPSQISSQILGSNAPTESKFPLSRRGFLAGAAATVVLAACGSDGDSAAPSAAGDGAAANGSTASSGSSPAAGTGDTWTLVQRFPQDVQTPGRLRLPISLSDGTDQLVQDGPATLTAVITDIDGNQIGEPVTAVRRDVAPGPYYDFRADIDTPGIFYLIIENGPEQGAAFQVMEPGTVAVAGRGEPLEPFDTPTVDDARGVDPICTRTPDPCPFHDVTLTDALASGKQVVYLIGTPAFCQTGSCAPALESMIDIFDEFSDTYTFVHAEVYTDNTATVPAPAVEAAGLTYEPALFITDTDGIVVERLDAVWDETELVEVLQAAST